MEYDKKNIGIIGYWFATNYGGVASYYSLYTKIQKMGYLPFLVEDPNLLKDRRKETAFSRIFFREVKANICEPYKNEELEKLNEYADTFLLGSDQVFTELSLEIHGRLFLMEFLDPDKKKIVISGSCGGESIKKSDNEELRAYARKELQTFSGVSIREISGVDVVRDYFRVDARYLIDPIFFTSAQEFRRIGKMANLPEKKDYMLAYILDPTEDKKRGIQEVAKMLGLNFEIALDGRQFTYDKNWKKVDLPEHTLPELDFKQWLHYYSNASFILTDSFHGMAMALILNIPFIAYVNHKRGSQRFTSLAQNFGVIDDRMIGSTEQISEKLLKERIDFAHINAVIKEQTKESEKWIQEHLSTPKEKLKPIALPGKSVDILLPEKMCTGCAACLNICSCHAIWMGQDEWGYYRAKVDREKCVDCGLCTKICPAIQSSAKENREIPDCYAFLAKDEQTVMASSSGGAFSVFAREIFKRKGVVVGAAWREDFSVGHIMIEEEKDLPKLQKSKYVQSDTGTIFSKVKERLNQGLYVLFTGCPCQVAGLKSYLGKEYDKLIAIDVFCGNVPSAFFFQKYLKEAFPQGVKKYQFRNKSMGYNCRCVEIELKDGTEIIHKEGKSSKEKGKTIVRKKGEEKIFTKKHDAYQQVYHNHVMCPIHCEKCKYQEVPRYGDLTMGDFWGIAAKDKEINTQKGVSVILCNNAKGGEFLQSIPGSEIEVLKKVPFEWVGGNGYAQKGKRNHASPKRDEFFDLVEKMPFSKAVNTLVKKEEKKEAVNSIVSYMKNSRIGRSVTFVYRKIRRGYRCYREHGLRHTWNRLLFHMRIKE